MTDTMPEEEIRVCSKTLRVQERDYHFDCDFVYRLKSTVDAEQADMKHDIGRLYQTNTDLVNESEGYRKTIRQLAEALRGCVNMLVSIHAFGAEPSQDLPDSVVPIIKRQSFKNAAKALTNNAPQIAEANQFADVSNMAKEGEG